MLYSRLRKEFSAPRVFGPHRPGALSLYYYAPPPLSTHFFAGHGKVYFPSSDNSVATPSTERSREVNWSAKAYIIVTAWSEWLSALRTASISPVRR